MFVLDSLLSRAVRAALAVLAPGGRKGGAYLPACPWGEGVILGGVANTNRAGGGVATEAQPRLGAKEGDVAKWTSPRLTRPGRCPESRVFCRCWGPKWAFSSYLSSTPFGLAEAEKEAVPPKSEEANNTEESEPKQQETPAERSPLLGEPEQGTPSLMVQLGLLRAETDRYSSGDLPIISAQASPLLPLHSVGFCLQQASRCSG